MRFWKSIIMLLTFAIFCFGSTVVASNASMDHGATQKAITHSSNSDADVVRPGSSKEPVRYIGSEWADINYHDGRLRPAVGVHSYKVMHCNRKYPKLSDGFGWTYNHAPNIAYFNGKFYVQYLSNPIEEHRGNGHTLLCHSVDGKNWSFPEVIFPVYNLDGEDYILMHQRMGFYVGQNGRLLVSGFYGIPTTSSNSPQLGNGIGRVVREVRPNGTFGPIYFIRYNRHSGFNENNTKYPLYSSSSDTGFVAACEELLSKKFITQQWWEEDRSKDGFYAIEAEGEEADGKFECEALSFYHRKDYPDADESVEKTVFDIDDLQTSGFIS